jgi:hypothetical protein
MSAVRVAGASQFLKPQASGPCVMSFPTNCVTPRPLTRRGRLTLPLTVTTCYRSLDHTLPLTYSIHLQKLSEAFLSAISWAGESQRLGHVLNLLHQMTLHHILVTD